MEIIIALLLVAIYILSRRISKDKSTIDRLRISYREWSEQQYDKEHSIRPMTKQDVPECIKMTMESFGNKYPKEQFETIEQEFNASFQEDWWGRPKYFVCEYRGTIFGMGGYALSWLDWDTFEFFWLCVRKGYEKHGIGKMLVDYREKEVLKESAFKKDITIMFSCTKEVINYHKKHGYKVLLEKAGGEEVIMGKTFLKSNI